MLSPEREKSFSQSIDMLVVIYDGTLLCAVELDWAVVVMLAPNSFDFLTGCGSCLNSCSAVLGENKRSKGIVDSHLYILKTSSRSARLHRSPNVRDEQ